MIGNGDQSGSHSVNESKPERDSQTHLEILCNFTDETLEGKFTNKKLRRLLVPSDFTESDGSGAETMRLFDTTSGGLECQVSTTNKT